MGVSCHKERGPVAVSAGFLTWQVDGLVPQEEAACDAPAIPSPGKGQDLAQPPHVIFEGGGANITHSCGRMASVERLECIKERGHAREQPVNTNRFILVHT